jgi:hypothetical protein
VITEAPRFDVFSVKFVLQRLGSARRVDIHDEQAIHRSGGGKCAGGEPFGMSSTLAGERVGIFPICP